jgi:hypothetical protein
MKNCSIDNCTNPVWSKGTCKNHQVKKPLAKTSGISNKKAKIVSNNDQFIEMRQFFLKIWSTRLHKSEVSGEYLGREAMSTYFHHILPKEKYPEAKLDEENIVLLSLEEHTNVENDMYKYEIINTSREYLYRKYSIV